MPAYVVMLPRRLPAVRATLRPYTERVMPLMAAYGGGYHRTSGQRLEVLEGDWRPPLVGLLKFPSFDRARDWYYSPEYTELKAVRQAHARNDLLLVEALEDGQPYDSGPALVGEARDRALAHLAAAERAGVSPDRFSPPDTVAPPATAPAAPEPPPIERIRALLPALSAAERRALANELLST